MAKKSKRRILFIDWEVQGALVLQTFVRWGVYLVTSLTLAVLWHVLSLSATSHVTFAEQLATVWTRYAPVFCALVLVLPVMVWDSVTTSHRFVGPIYRLRATLCRLAQGEDVGRLSFRQKDYWQQLAAEFNAVLDRIERAKDAAETRPDVSATSTSRVATCGRATPSPRPGHGVCGPRDLPLQDHLPGLASLHDLEGLLELVDGPAVGDHRRDVQPALQHG
jgi:hypothetical protein